MSNWVFAAPWGIKAVLAAGAVLALLWLLRAWQERRRVAFARQAGPLAARFLALGLIVWVALDPTLFSTSEMPSTPRLSVLVDTSASMATADVDAKERLAAVLAALQDDGGQAELEDEFTLDALRFDQSVQPTQLQALQPADATGEHSNLAAALSQAIHDQARRPDRAGVLLLSDGRATDRGLNDVAALALAKSVPLWTCCVGGHVDRRDLWLESERAEVLAFSRDEIPIAVSLHQVGLPNQAFKVELVHADQVLQTRDVLPTPAGDGKATFRVDAATLPQGDEERADGGEYRFVLRATPQPGEADLENNEQAVFVRVLADRVRVLVVEGQPHWDSKFLVQALKKDPQVAVSALYRLNDKRYVGVAANAEGGEERRVFAMEQALESLDDYDLVIFGRGCEAFMGSQAEDALTAFVAEKGGGVVFARGKAYQGRCYPLAKLEPVVWGGGDDHGLRMQLTDAGAESAIFQFSRQNAPGDFVKDLPPFDRVRHTSGEKTLAVVLARAGASTGNGQAPILMAYHNYGLGRVVALNAGGIWRWHFRDKPDAGDEEVYRRFWRSLVRWLMSSSTFQGGRNVALRTNRRRYTDEQELTFLVATRGIDLERYRPTLTIAEDDGGEAVVIDPQPQGNGELLARSRPLPAGSYRVTLEGNLGEPRRISTRVEVVKASAEARDLSADPEAMRMLAEKSGGAVVGLDDLNALARRVQQWRVAQQYPDQKRSQWDRWWLLLLLVGLLGYEWFGRRQRGLL